ncbi:MAG: DUF5320 domain-containing protein [Thermodesulfobacteriota bacterium]|nr:DUF5320 domain-containing protein [Thermodesulfobacteriota bacterium]
MPGFDGTGPAGIGPMTGWGQGYCNPAQSAYASAPAGRAGYWGFGFRRGLTRAQGRGLAPAFFSGFRRGTGRGRGFGRRGIYLARRTW